jgi:hypothetical protein
MESVNKAVLLVSHLQLFLTVNCTECSNKVLILQINNQVIKCLLTFYWCQTRSLKLREKLRVRIFEDKMLRSIERGSNSIVEIIA